jgi:hypothetical protein
MDRQCRYGYCTIALPVTIPVFSYVLQGQEGFQLYSPLQCKVKKVSEPHTCPMIYPDTDSGSDRRNAATSFEIPPSSVTG